MNPQSSMKWPTDVFSWHCCDIVSFVSKWRPKCGMFKSGVVSTRWIIENSFRSQPRPRQFSITIRCVSVAMRQLHAFWKILVGFQSIHLPVGFASLPDLVAGCWSPCVGPATRLLSHSGGDRVQVCGRSVPEQRPRQRSNSEWVTEVSSTTEIQAEGMMITSTFGSVRVEPRTQWWRSRPDFQWWSERQRRTWLSIPPLALCWACRGRASEGVQLDNQDTEVVAFGLSLYENSLVDKFNPDGAQPRHVAYRWWKSIQASMPLTTHGTLIPILPSVLIVVWTQVCRCACFKWWLGILKDGTTC